MAMAPIFIDATTSLHWGTTTAVGIVRVERYLIQYLLENYKGPLGIVVFDKPSGVFRSIAVHEMAELTRLIYGLPRASDGQHKRSKLEQMRRLNYVQMVDLSSQFFDSRIRRKLETAGVPRFLTEVSAATFRTSAAAASVLVKMLPDRSASSTASADAEAAVPERTLAVFETYRDRRSSDAAWLYMAGLTWDYMYYPTLHKMDETGRVNLAHVIYDTIPVDFPQFVPNASHLYHRHFVEVAQAATLLYAISKHSADRFTKAVLEPNLLETKIEAHGLPDFLSAAVGSPRPSPRLNGRRFAVFCSTIEARKNHALLLAVWRRLLRRLPKDQVPTLVFVGKWGWAFESVKNQIELDPALEKHVIVLAEVPDDELVWIYKNAEFSLFPSFTEGWGLAVPESLYHGTPAFISTAPALDEAAQGLMPRLDPEDPLAWEAAINEFLTSEEARQTLRDRATAFAPTPLDGFARKFLELTVGTR